MKKAALFIATSMAVLAGTAISSSQAASFNCRYAKLPAEVAICQSDTLSRLDERMAAKYYRLRRNLDHVDRAQLKDDQRFWLRQRNRCGYNLGCLEDSYYRRIDQLNRF